MRKLGLLQWPIDALFTVKLGQFLLLDALKLCLELHTIQIVVLDVPVFGPVHAFEGEVDLMRLVVLLM